MSAFTTSRLVRSSVNIWNVQVRCVAHGEMYMPKALYKMRGPPKSNRHIRPEFAKMRSQKFIKVNLPKRDSYYAKKMSEENFALHVRNKLKELGLEATRPSIKQSRYYLGCSNSIIDQYVPPENEGVFSELAGGRPGFKGALKEKAVSALGKTKDVAFRRWQRALAKIKQADGEFELGTFGERALRIYIEAHDVLQRRDQERLLDLVTEHAFPTMWKELENKTLRWEYVRSLEPPTVVHLRDLGDQDTNVFGQATVRLHSQQKLAIYDQFGRLYMGSEHVARDVLEYIVLENFLSNEYGIWRLHGKIPSKKSSESPEVLRTYQKPVKDSDSGAKELRYGYKLDESKLDEDSKSEKQLVSSPSALV